MTNAYPGPVADSVGAGAIPGSGTFFCLGCGSQLSLDESDRLPQCPRCNGSTFRRDSIFESMQEHGPSTIELALPKAPEPAEWLREARESIPGPGSYLAYRDQGEIHIFPVEEGWTRIGRSAAADIRLDHPSVSRRHALIVLEKPKAMRVLDDRSLNGLFVNGEVVDWSRLGDGDELEIGRYRLVALEA